MAEETKKSGESTPTKPKEGEGHEQSPKEGTGDTPEELAKKFSSVFDKGYGDGSRRARSRLFADLSDATGVEVTEENVKEVLASIKKAQSSEDEKGKTKKGEETKPKAEEEARLAEMREQLQAKDNRIVELTKTQKQLQEEHKAERQEMRIMRALNDALKGNDLRKEVNPSHVAALFRKDFNFQIDPDTQQLKLYRTREGQNDQYQVDHDGNPQTVETVAKNWLLTEASYFLRPPEGGANLGGGRTGKVGGKPKDVKDMTLEDVKDLSDAELDEFVKEDRP